MLRHSLAVRLRPHLAVVHLFTHNRWYHLAQILSHGSAHCDRRSEYKELSAMQHHSVVWRTLRPQRLAAARRLAVDIPSLRLHSLFLMFLLRKTRVPPCYGPLQPAATGRQVVAAVFPW
jgi:hypothetical protein